MKLQLIQFFLNYQINFGLFLNEKKENLMLIFKLMYFRLLYKKLLHSVPKYFY